jgi:excisionase family DNA binding protein
MEVEELLTCQQVSEALGVSVNTVWRWIRDGKLPAKKLGGKLYRIYKADLEKFLAEAG